MFCQQMRVLVVVLMLTSTIKCEFGVVRAYTRYPGCMGADYSETDAVSGWTERLMPKEDQNMKGYSGTLAVIGGAAETSGAAYFTAITALKIGIDAVQIFCTSLYGDTIKSYSPDITVYPILNTAVDRVISLLMKVDIVVLGPGLDKDAHSLNTVIPKVIQHCKAEKKPLIIDFELYFLTPTIINSLAQFPYPGVIILPNAMEFDKLYELMKTPTSSSSVSIDLVKFGENIYILRKGCTDVGISTNPESTWTLTQGGSARRSAGQGHMLAGAVATYYFWAMKKIPEAKSYSRGPMFKAAIATYAAAQLIRRCNQMSFELHNRSMMTSDMIANIFDAVNNIDD